MAEIKIINEIPLTLAEMKEHLANIEKRDKELNFRTNKTKEYLDIFTKLNKKQADELKQKIIALNIPRLKDRHIVKILDILPEEDLDSLKILFTGENITIKQEDLQRIFDIVKEYSK